MNIVSLLHQTAQAFGDRPAVSVGSATHLSYVQISNRAARLAGSLRNRLALRAGDRVLLVMRNTPYYFEVLFAIWHAGLVAVPVNAQLHPREVKYILENSAASACFVTPDCTHAVGELGDRCQIVCVGDQVYERLLSEPVSAAATARDDTAWIFYTSGTTGKPKGAMLTHDNLRLMCWSYLCDADGFFPGDAFFLLGPLSHACGLMSLTHISKASNHVLPESGGFDPVEVGSLVDSYQNSTLFAAPTMLRRMLDSSGFSCDITRIRTIVGGGAPFHANDILRILDTFGPRFCNGYGQGECPCTISMMPKHFYQLGLDERRMTSVGLPRTGVEIRLAAADGREAAADEPGEVLVRSEIVMKGYLGNAAATAEALREGWLHTGDIGVRDRDGFLSLIDRNKDVIISGGSNIYPREVEDVLLSDSAVADVAVVGEPDHEWGESVAAFVVPHPGSPLTAEHLERLCLDNLARFKRPRRYIFLSALPRNSTGKVQKAELRARLRSGPDLTNAQGLPPTRNV